MAAASQAKLRAASCDLVAELTGSVTDGFLEALLRGMAVSFALSDSYRQNIDGFDAVFVFRTRDGRVGATAVFQYGTLNVESEPRSTFDTRISFQDSDGLSKSLLAGDQDILNTMLSSPVDAEGNLSYLYRFGFLAKELTLQLGVG